jgi:serine O-acetyltransferase
LLSLLSNHTEHPPRRAWFHPSFICVLLYRISNYFYRSNHRWSARIIWHINLLLTGADISEPADLGEGLLIMNPAGTAIMGTAGRNLTVMPCAGLGAEVGRLKDIGAGPGYCKLGDDVVLEPHSGVLGPVKVGNRVRVGAGIALTRDVPDDTIVEGPRPRFISRKDLA